MSNVMMPDTPATSARCRAFHEAGHAAVALHFGITFESVDLGGVRSVKRRAGDSLLSHICIAAGGIVASRLALEREDFSGLDLQGCTLDEWAKSGSRHDGRAALALARQHISGENDALEFVREAQRETEILMPSLWRAVRLIANTLARRSTLTFAEARELFTLAGGTIAL